jgi:hypothetical protein
MSRKGILYSDIADLNDGQWQGELVMRLHLVDDSGQMALLHNALWLAITLDAVLRLAAE